MTMLTSPKSRLPCGLDKGLRRTTNDAVREKGNGRSGAGMVKAKKGSDIRERFGGMPEVEEGPWSIETGTVRPRPAAAEKTAVAITDMHPAKHEAVGSRGPKPRWAPGPVDFSRAPTTFQGVGAKRAGAVRRRAVFRRMRSEVALDFRCQRREAARTLVGLQCLSKHCVQKAQHFKERGLKCGYHLHVPRWAHMSGEIWIAARPGLEWLGSLDSN